MSATGEGTGTARLARDDVVRVAALARLAVSDEEIERLRYELASILDRVAQLNELDTANIPPSAAVLPLRNVMADDEPRPGLTLEQVLANAPAVVDDQFRVPPIFEEQ